LYPLRRPKLRVERFAYDLTEFFARPPEAPPPAIPNRATTVGFARTPNLRHCEFRITEEVERLLELCDGRRTGAELVRELAGGGGHPGADPDDVVTGLRRLYTAGVITFHDRPVAGSPCPQEKACTTIFRS